MVYTVGKMAKLLGVPASTLRYYDKEGLLPFVERSPGGRRMFQEKDCEWLQTIACMKKTGMSLRDIRVYIDMAMRGDETMEPRLQLLSRRREAVRAHRCGAEHASGGDPGAIPGSPDSPAPAAKAGVKLPERRRNTLRRSPYVPQMLCLDRLRPV